MAPLSGKAPDMGWVNPYLYVKDITRAQKFYEDTFGFTTSMTLPDAQGTTTHVEMRYRDAVIMLGAEDERPEIQSPLSLGGSPGGLYIYVDDVDGLYRRVKSSGGRITAEPADKFWGDRVFAAQCPEGHNWFFAQRVHEFDPGKMPG